MRLTETSESALRANTSRCATEQAVTTCPMADVTNMKHWVLPMAELLFWLAVQRVYAVSIGESYARPMNDVRPSC